MSTAAPGETAERVLRAQLRRVPSSGQTAVELAAALDDLAALRLALGILAGAVAAQTEREAAVRRLVIERAQSQARGYLPS